MTEPLMFGFGGDRPLNEDYPLEFMGHYLIGMNSKTEEDDGYWNTPQEARLEFSIQFAELSSDAEGKFLFVRKAPMLEMLRPFDESEQRYRMVGRFSIAKLREKNT